MNKPSPPSTTAPSAVADDDADRMTGEARVCTVGTKFAILSQPGLDGTIFVQPSSLKGSSTLALPSVLHYNDVCEFVAVRQTERNGSKWCAVDGTVRVVRTAHMYEGEGVITKLDTAHGQFGFIHSSLGDVFFNASCVRPVTKHVGKVLSVCQRVRFTAIDGTSAHHVQLRATAVHAMPKPSTPPPSLIVVNEHHGRLPRLPMSTDPQWHALDRRIASGNKPPPITLGSRTWSNDLLTITPSYGPALPSLACFEPSSTYLSPLDRLRRVCDSERISVGDSASSIKKTPLYQFLTKFG